MSARSTLVAQSGIFPVGDVAIPLPPAIAATSVIFPSTAALAPLDKSFCRSPQCDPYEGFYYGGVDTPTTHALARALGQLEGARFCVLTPSGQSAVHVTLSALLKHGDHVLVADTVIYTTRWYCDHLRAAHGIEVTYYSPDVRTEIAGFIRPNTKIIVLESPGSLTFEVQDVPAICAVAAKHGVVTVLDNTWAASLLFKPFEKGADISVVSLAKYHGAPAAVSLGSVTTNNKSLYDAIKVQAALLGLHVAPEGCAKVAAALTTLAVRLAYQDKSAQHVIAALSRRADLGRIMHPSVADAPGHDIWLRDFSGGNSLMSLEFPDMSREEVRRVADNLRLIKIGFGWGGAVSLVALFAPNEWRTVSRAEPTAPCMRIYLGLESPDDLLEDIENAIRRVRRRRGRRGKIMAVADPQIAGRSA